MMRRKSFNQDIDKLKHVGLRSSGNRDIGTYKTLRRLA